MIQALLARFAGAAAEDLGAEFGNIIRGGLSGKGGSKFAPVHMEIETNISRIQRSLAHKPRQIAQATAWALTNTAKDIQQAEVREIFRVFNVRGSWWKENSRHGIRTKKAVKSRLEAKVHTSAYWLVDHVTGATRYPQNGNVHRAIPKSERITRTKTGRVSKRWSPSALMEGKGFKVDLGNGRSLILRRFGNKKSREAETMYYLIPEAHIKKTFDWYGVAEKIFYKTWNANADRAVRRALRTAK